jgi:hypothetical protein
MRFKEARHNATMIEEMYGCVQGQFARGRIGLGRPLQATQCSAKQERAAETNWLRKTGRAAAMQREAGWRRHLPIVKGNARPWWR